jgi:hypothetical protein
MVAASFSRSNPAERTIIRRWLGLGSSTAIVVSIAWWRLSAGIIASSGRGIETPPFSLSGKGFVVDPIRVIDN